MRLELSARECRMLLSSAQPASVLLDQLPLERLDDLSKDVGTAFEGSLHGNVVAARRLTEVWRGVVDELVTTLQPCANGVVLNRSAIEARLPSLPLLEAVHSNPLAGLYEWSLVSLRESMADPIPYVAQPDIDTEELLAFMTAVVTAANDSLGPVTRIKSTLGVSNAELGRWVKVTPQSISLYELGRTAPSAPAAERLTQIDRLAQTFSEVLKPGLTATVFAARPVPLLGGRTYQQALDAGYSANVLTDVARRGAGRQPLTDEGDRYLNGPRAAAELSRFREESAAPAGTAPPDPGTGAARPVAGAGG